MTLIVTTLSGLQTFTDVASLDSWQVDGLDYYQISFFNPQKPEVEIDKTKVLLIQVVK